MAETANLDLPLLAAGQAGKHITVNEALTRIDQLVMLGDNPATDLAGAKALGIKAILTSARSPDVFETLVRAR